jgi:integrase
MEHWSIPYFANMRLTEIEPPDVRAFVTHLETAGLRPSSVRAVLAPLKAMYATAVEDSAVRSNPTRDVRVWARRQPEERVEIRAMTRAEIEQLLSHTPERWRLLFEFLAHTGLRISEAAGLEWRDVEFGEHPHLHVRRQDCRGEVGDLKSEHSRRKVPLSPGMAARLWALGADQPTTGRVFTSPSGLRLNDGNLRRRVLRPATEAAGIPWVTFHSFRHTCASLLFEAGRDVKQVSAWLGHSDPAFTLRTYIHLMDGGVGDAAFMDEVLGNGWATQQPGKVIDGTGAEAAETPAMQVIL